MQGKGWVIVMDTIETKLQELLNSGLSGEELLEAWVTVVNNRKDR